MKLLYALTWLRFTRSIFALLLLTGCNPSSDGISPDNSLDLARLRSSVSNSSTDCVAKTPNPTMLCPLVYAPVCGCNNVTYANSCLAERVGIRVDYSGACKTPTPTTPAPCPSLYAPVCGTNNVTYANSCLANRADIKVAYSGECKTTAPPTPAPCPAVYVPVCGINNVTYSNACIADRAGVKVAYNGECRTTPAPVSDCVEKTPNPTMVCSLVYAPVCGCNKVTYSNACLAERVGITVAYAGECKK